MSALVCCLKPALADNAVWADHWGYGLPVQTICDGDGNTYVSGTYYESLTIQGMTIGSPELYTGFLAKFNSDGVIQWLSNIESTDYLYIHVLQLDMQGNILLVGGGVGMLSFGGTLAGNESDNFARGFLARYNTDGACTDIAGTNGESDVYFMSVAEDASGNYYVAGAYYDSFHFGVSEVPFYGVSDALIVQFDHDFNARWAKGFGDSGDDGGVDIAIGSDGNLVVCGYFENSFLFDGYFFANYGQSDMFVLKMDDTGTFLWVKTMGSVNYEKQFEMDLLLDDADDVYFAANMVNELNHPGGITTSYGGVDFFVIKLDHLYGNFDWIRNGGGSDEDYVYDLVMGNNNNLYIAGYFQGAAEVDGLQLLATTGKDGFYAELNTDGFANLVWQTEGDNDEQLFSIAVDPYNNVLAGGIFYSNIHFDGVGDFNIGTDIVGTFLVKMETQYTVPETAIAISVPANNLHVFPNPATESVLVSIETAGLDIQAVDVLNMFGQRVLHVDVQNENTVQIDVSTLPAGQYLVAAISTQNTIAGTQNLEIMH
ncbi:MAG: T9SS type A sorting domain-containing protein [Chitinophagales bacterium]